MIDPRAAAATPRLHSPRPRTIYGRAAGAPDAELSRLRKGPRRDRGQGRGAADPRPQERRDERRGRGGRRSTARPRRCSTSSTATSTPGGRRLVARHPERPHCKDYIDGAVHRVDAARRRPQLRRRPCGDGRARPVQRPPGGGDRPREGQRHPLAHRAQLRHGPARGLPQGDPADGPRRPLRPAGRSPSSTPPAPIPARAPRSAARPRRSPARPRSACRSACRSSRSSSARAARAAPSPSPPPTASPCSSTRSTR